MKSPMLLWNVLLTELGEELGIDASRDFLTASRRIEHEGDEFLTITLPTLRKAFERALDEGRWNAHVCTAFAVHKGLPRFLGGFFELVFDRDTGVILENPNISAVRAIRQLTGVFGSLLPEQSGAGGSGCTEGRLEAAFVHYLETDFAVASHSESLDSVELLKFTKAFDAIFGRMLRDVELLVYSGRLRPRHSGGATADKLKGNQKWTFPEWTERLETVFPYLDNTLPSLSLSSHRLNEDGRGLAVQFRSPEDELPVRVIAVPKTCEKPRIISIEPSYMQYMQQAIGREFMRGFRDDPLIKQVISLNDRTRNQEAAKLGSLDGSLATLDLKDASDRLSWTLVQSAFKYHPWLSRAIDVTRSRTANVSGAGVHTLAKFASMGSALTFPVQTMVFTTLAFMGIAEAHDITVKQAFVRFTSQVRVFGDDIIVPTDTVGFVIEQLEAYGFQLNTAKSFWTGRFRESCGGDYFAGEDVSYVKVRRRLPDHKGEVEATVSAVALRNRLYEYGLWGTVAFLDNLLASVLQHYPTVSFESSLLGRASFLEPENSELDADLQVPVGTGYVVQSKLPNNRIEGVDALTRYFFESSQDDGDREAMDVLRHVTAAMPDIDRFDRSGRPARVVLKRRRRPL